MKASSTQRIDEFCDALWLEDGLSRNTLDSYRRDLLNGIRRDLGFGAVPVRMNFRSSKNPFADKD